MRGHRLGSRSLRVGEPNGTHFFGGVVTNSENEIQLRRGRPGELVPTLAAQIVGRNMCSLKSRQCLRSNHPRRMTSRTISHKARLAFKVENGFSHNRPRRIPGAQKQNVVMGRHGRDSSQAFADEPQQPGSQQSLFGLVARRNALANLPSTSAAIASTSMPALHLESSWQNCAAVAPPKE